MAGEAGKEGGLAYYSEVMGPGVLSETKGAVELTRIPLAVFPDVFHSLPNRSLDIANTCISKRIVLN
jgi:hypothetical protein